MNRLEGWIPYTEVDGCPGSGLGELPDPIRGVKSAQQFESRN